MRLMLLLIAATTLPAWADDPYAPYRNDRTLVFEPSCGVAPDHPELARLRKLRAPVDATALKHDCDAWSRRLGFFGKTKVSVVTISGKTLVVAQCEKPFPKNAILERKVAGLGHCGLYLAFHKVERPAKGTLKQVDRDGVKVWEPVKPREGMQLVQLPEPTWVSTKAIKVEVRRNSRIIYEKGFAYFVFYEPIKVPEGWLLLTHPPSPSGPLCAVEAELMSHENDDGDTIHKLKVPIMVGQAIGIFTRNPLQRFHLPPAGK